ncbi:Fic family protein [Candidatus Woesearchaeota archaeon]|nr:Fic family protein [Candidatus Woesearchaeota archaeon]
MLKGLVQTHPFASGNRRTAFAVVENFLIYNGEKTKVNKSSNPKIMQGIRENYYSYEEIKNWLKGDEIREFQR